MINPVGNLPYTEVGKLTSLVLLFFLIIFPECANTEQFRTAGSWIKIFGLDFYQLTEESNPGRLGEKRERYLCAMPSPPTLVLL